MSGLEQMDGQRDVKAVLRTSYKKYPFNERHKQGCAL
jgi:hypothetical protein